MFVALLIVALILFGFGFLNPLWWLAAAVLVFGSTRYGHNRGGIRGRSAGSGFGNYRDYDNHRERRYSRQNRARWTREDRRDHERHR
ncbi:hypothetical protein ACWD3I_46220 [Streptomyces sp. NPDC002817]|uniref:hypothetical protein n=1 Tax=Streptomyces sp. NPDC088357 TaxID=3154655 RepID=UPI00342C265E